MGSKFTRCNNRPGFANIRERLDRCISILPWQVAYPNAIISHYPITNSDHCLLLLSLFGSVDAAPKSFKFEGFWLHNSSCMSVVSDAWNSVSGAGFGRVLFKKNRAVQYALRNWNKHVFCNIQSAIKNVKE